MTGDTFDYTGKLLIHEPPLQALPTLATLIGLSEAILLQQLHYWINFGYTDDRMPILSTRGKKFRRIPPEVLAEKFPFWEHRNIQRLVKTLRGFGLVVTENLNSNQIDRTLWYAVDYEKLDALEGAGVERRKKPGRKPKTNSDHDVIITSSKTQSLRHDSAIVTQPSTTRKKQQDKQQQPVVESDSPSVENSAEIEALTTALYRIGVTPRKTAAALAISHPELCRGWLDYLKAHPKLGPGYLVQQVKAGEMPPVSSAEPEPVKLDPAAVEALAAKLAQAEYDKLGPQDKLAVDKELQGRPIVECVRWSRMVRTSARAMLKK